MVTSNDVEFKSLEECFERLDGYKNVNEIKTIDDFENYLNIIAYHHSENGLEESQLAFIVPFTFLKNLKKKTLSLLIQCLIPKNLVPADLVTKVILHILSFHETFPPYHTVTLIKWIIGIMEYKLTDVSMVDNFYHTFYSLLFNSNEEVHKYALTLIYLLTKPEDVSESIIIQIIRFQQKWGKTKQSIALLSLFKIYRPEKVSLAVPFMKTFIIPQYIVNDKMKEALSKATERNSEDEINVSHTKLFPAGDVKPYKNKIMEISVLHIENNTCKSLKKLSEIKSISEVEESYNSLLLPTNVLGFLSNDPGIHLLAFGERSLQFKLIYRLNTVFDKVFISQTLKVSQLEKIFLLERVFALEEYLQQGLYVVSKFLSSFLPFWNSVDYRVQILNLLKWITFSSFEELEEGILQPLFNIFITSDVNYMCDIILALTEFLKNMFQVDVFRYENDFSPLFLNEIPGYVKTGNPARTLGAVIKSIEKFINFGYLIYPKSLMFLNCSISFHEVLLELEKKSDFAEVTVIKFPIVYLSLFSTNPTPLTRVCRLLNGYQSVINHLAAEQTVSNLENPKKIIRLYCSDLMNCLWYNQAFSHRGTGLIFKEMKSTFIKKLSEIVPVDSVLSVTQHVMFLPTLFSILQADQSLSLPFELSEKNIMPILETYMPDIAEFIKSQLDGKDENSIIGYYR